MTLTLSNSSSTQFCQFAATNTSSLISCLIPPTQSHLWSKISLLVLRWVLLSVSLYLDSIITNIKHKSKKRWWVLPGRKHVWRERNPKRWIWASRDEFELQKCEINARTLRNPLGKILIHLSSFLLSSYAFFVLMLLWHSSELLLLRICRWRWLKLLIIGVTLKMMQLLRFWESDEDEDWS